MKAAVCKCFHARKLEHRSECIPRARKREGGTHRRAKNTGFGPAAPRESLAERFAVVARRSVAERQLGRHGSRGEHDNLATGEETRPAGDDSPLAWHLRFQFSQLVAGRNNVRMRRLLNEAAELAAVGDLGHAAASVKNKTRVAKLVAGDLRHGGTVTAERRQQRAGMLMPVDADRRPGEHRDDQQYGRRGDGGQIGRPPAEGGGLSRFVVSAKMGLSPSRFRQAPG